MLVDCGPDLRQQLLSARVDRLNGAIVTHTHGDHCHGIDELRPVAQAIGGPVPLHGRSDVLEELERRFSYAFELSQFYRPIVEPRIIAGDVKFGSVSVHFVDQPHGETCSLGMRFDEDGAKIGYAVDFSDLTDEMADLYRSCDVWIADCLTRQPHPTHMHLDQLLSYARDLEVVEAFSSTWGTGSYYRIAHRRSARLGCAGL